MRALAAIIHYAVIALMLVASLAVAMIVLPFLAAHRMTRWAELRYVYGGDAKARDKDRWRGH